MEKVDHEEEFGPGAVDPLAWTLSKSQMTSYYGPWSKVVDNVGNRVPFQMQPLALQASGVGVVKEGMQAGTELERWTG